jgi:hypothetical protein
MAMSLEEDLKNLADATLPDWGDITFSSTRLDEAIRDLYRSHLRFPPSWSEEDCDEFVAENADMAATRLSTTLDDIIDRVIDGCERRPGIRPHHDDVSKMIEAAHRLAIDELEYDIDALQEELAGR